MKRNINKLFANLCCSECKADFTEESINILREEEDFSVLQIVCSNCGKSFGIAFLGENNAIPKNYKDEELALELQDGPNPINSDDVINAHKFIKKMGSDWNKYLPKDYRDKKI